MSRPSCITCDVNAAAASSCQHHSHAGADHKNHTFSIFPDLHDQQQGGGQQEFQFFGQSDQESVAWLFDDDPPPTVGGDGRSPDENHLSFHPFGLQYHPGNGLTFEASLDQREVDAAGGGDQQLIREPAASATIMSFCGSTFTDAASSRRRDPILIDHGLLQRPIDPSVEREAKVMRYREKKKRRCFDKQIRYASRKAYAEMRPRVKGRFAMVPETAAPQKPALASTCYDPNRLDLGRWFH